MRKNIKERLNTQLIEDVNFAKAYEDLLFAEKFAQTIYDLRIEHKLTQMNLAQITGIKQVEISKIENSKLIPNVITMGKLLHVFHKQLTISEMK